MANMHPKRNGCFKKAPQGLDEAKSRGQVQRAKNTNLIKSARTLFDNAEILPNLIDNVRNQVEMGVNKDALELLKIIKEPDKQEIDLIHGVQKVYVTKEQQKEVDKHIEKLIDD